MADWLDPAALVRRAGPDPRAAWVREQPYSCFGAGLTGLVEAARERPILLAACSPALHGPTLARALAAAGLPADRVRLVDVRGEGWTCKARPRGTVFAEAALAEALEEVDAPADLPAPHRRVTVVGGGPAADEAAALLEAAGIPVDWVDEPVPGAGENDPAQTELSNGQAGAGAPPDGSPASGLADVPAGTGAEQVAVSGADAASPTVAGSTPGAASLSVAGASPGAASSAGNASPLGAGFSLGAASSPGHIDAQRPRAQLSTGQDPGLPTVGGADSNQPAPAGARLSAGQVTAVARVDGGFRLDRAGAEPLVAGAIVLAFEPIDRPAEAMRPAFEPGEQVMDLATAEATLLAPSAQVTHPPAVVALITGCLPGAGRNRAPGVALFRTIDLALALRERWPRARLVVFTGDDAGAPPELPALAAAFRRDAGGLLVRGAVHRGVYSERAIHVHATDADLGKRVMLAADLCIVDPGQSDDPRARAWCDMLALPDPGELSASDVFTRIPGVFVASGPTPLSSPEATLRGAACAAHCLARLAR